MGTLKPRSFAAAQDDSKLRVRGDRVLDRHFEPCAEAQDKLREELWNCWIVNDFEISYA
jgi:hypothetical protein